MEAEWKKCNACKKSIGFNSPYFVCSVSTCRGKATNFAFCTVSCWSSHIGLFNHRSAFAEEKKSPEKS